VDAGLASAQSTVASLENELRCRVQEADDVRSQLQQLNTEHDASSSSALLTACIV